MNFTEEEYFTRVALLIDIGYAKYAFVTMY